ncbi:MAG: PilC/PilY family type IV pilus protein [Candidatus Thiodiazotropha sp.]
MNIPHRFNLKRTSTSLSLLLGITLGQPILADDVEIYLIEPVKKAPPNVLFLLDESLSMSWDLTGNDGSTGEPSRMNELKRAMKAILGNARLENTNVALLGYSTTYFEENAPLSMHAYSDEFSLLKDNKLTLETQVENLEPRNYTPTVKALEQAVAWFRTDQTFTDIDNQSLTSPLENLDQDETWCSSNHIILLTDGIPNSNDPEVYGLDTYEGTECSDEFEQNERCAREIAAWAHTHDVAPNDHRPEQQHITTHTIGFLTDDDTSTFLGEIAHVGGGDTYSAENWDTLATAIVDILDTAQDNVTYAYTAPVIPFNQNNAAISGDKIYIPMFASYNSAFWKGNLKSFNITVDNSGDSTSINLTDAGNNPIINDNYQFVSAQDNWSQTRDGGDPLVNGAAAHMGGQDASRNLYTYLGSTDVLSDESNAVDIAHITPEMLNVASETTRNDLINWITWNWTAPPPATPDDDPEPSHEGVMGAPLHTRPAIVNYGNESVIYLPTSEGVLEAIDAETGVELWAFMPRELLPGISTIKDNKDTAVPYYGLDGPMTVYEVNGKKFVIFGMRRGGKSYYILNITDRLHPEYVARINDPNPSETGDSFDGLGQTWSKPLLTRMYRSGGPVDVLVFGGGYDSTEDSATTRPDRDAEGNVIFIVNPTTGERIQKISSSTPGVTGMKYSIAADALPFDINRNGIMDRIYVADVGGQIIRIDIPENAEDSLSGGVIADMSGNTSDSFRRFFNTPEIGYYNRNGIQYLAILIGSGNRTQPLDAEVVDNFFMIKDRNVWSAPEIYKTIEFEDLYNATDNLVQDAEGEARATAAANINSMDGWRIELNSSEKSFSRALLYNYAVLFTTYSATRVENQDPCESQGASGVARFYAINMVNGAAMFGSMDGDDGVLNGNDRSKILNINTIPPTPSLLFPENGEGRLGSVIKAMVGLEEVTEWPMQLIPITWEEVFDE